MTVVHDEVIDRAITCALGEEIRRARENAGLSQSQLVARMPTKLHPKTLASYEQGARQCTVVRLCQIAVALGVSATDLLARALLRAQVDVRTVRMVVDLKALVSDTRAEILIPLRRWGKARLVEFPQSEVVRLDETALQEMAVIFQVPLIDLIGQLAMFTPLPARANPTLQ